MNGEMTWMTNKFDQESYGKRRHNPKTTWRRCLGEVEKGMPKATQK
jgi:hypothetical protein